VVVVIGQNIGQLLFLDCINEVMGIPLSEGSCLINCGQTTLQTATCLVEYISLWTNYRYKYKPVQFKTLKAN